jgi:hypothetical protein
MIKIMLTVIMAAFFLGLGAKRQLKKINDASKNTIASKLKDQQLRVF